MIFGRRVGPGAGDLVDGCREVGKRVDEDRPSMADLAGDDRDRRVGAGAGEADRARPLAELDAVEAGEEVEVPPVATELAVGDRSESDAELLLDDVADRVVLDRRQLACWELAVAPALTDLGEVARTQQAADMVGASRQGRHHYLRGRGLGRTGAARLMGCSRRWRPGRPAALRASGRRRRGARRSGAHRPGSG